MPEYRVVVQTPTGPATYTAHAATREHAEEATAELYALESRGGTVHTIRATPVARMIPEE